MARAHATYTYCVVAHATRPRTARRNGLPGTGPVRIIDVDRGLYLVVADAPLARYGAEAINRGLANLDWVSRAAAAHEAVVESFAAVSAVLPMKLFTIFTSDDRALAHVRSERTRIATAARRVANHQEWGVRVILDRAVTGAMPSNPRRGRGESNGRPSGTAYLTRKKAQRDAGLERARHARAAIAALYDRLAARATLARRKAPRDLPVQGGPLLLDAAFLVPRRRARSFQSFAAREAGSLARSGYALTLTGPWPPYSFVGE
jgi:hypothetical protein